MQKKIIISILIFSLLFCSFSVIVTSENKPTVILSITNASANANDEVKVSLTVSANSMIAAAELIVNYDATRLAVISSINGKVLSTGMGVSNPKFSPTKIKVSCLHVNGFQSAGSILEMKFKIKEAATGNIPLTLEVQNLVDNQSMPISYVIVNGNISVNSNEIYSHGSSVISSLSKNLLSSNYSSSLISYVDLNSSNVSKSSESIYNKISESTDDVTFNIIGSITDSKGKKLNGYIIEIPSLKSFVKLYDQGKFTVNNVNFRTHVIYLKDNKGLIIGTLLFVVSRGNKTAISNNGIMVSAQNIRLDLELTDNVLKIKNVKSINEKGNSTIFIIVIVLVVLLLVTGIYVKFNSK